MAVSQIAYLFKYTYLKVQYTLCTYQNSAQHLSGWCCSKSNPAASHLLEITIAFHNRSQVFYCYSLNATINYCLICSCFFCVANMVIIDGEKCQVFHSIFGLFRVCQLRNQSALVFLHTLSVNTLMHSKFTQVQKGAVWDPAYVSCSCCCTNVKPSSCSL